MRPLAEVLADQGYSVEMIRLPGHGTALEDLIPKRWDDFRTAVETAYDELAARSEKTAIVGLSMGGGLCAWLAENRQDLDAIVVINPWVRALAPDLVEGGLQLVAAGMEYIEGVGSDIKKDGSIEAAYPGTPLLAAKSVSDALIDVEANLSRITASALLISSREDHTVLPENGDVFAAGVSGPIERVYLENSYHVATLDNDAAQLESATVAFLARVFAS
jgi:carboxylesterase